MFDYAKARSTMVDCQIHPNGVIDPRILSAFETLPREKFLPANKKPVAYQDEDIKLENGRILMEPQVNARMIQLIKPVENDIALVIGDASGYVAAVLGGMVNTVISLEEDKNTIAAFEKIHRELGICNVAGVSGKLDEGAADQGPYSFIFINGSVSDVPPAILQQLSPDGRLITIVKKPGHVMGEVTLYEAGEGGYASPYAHFKAGCPYLKGFEPQESFVF